MKLVHNGVQSLTQRGSFHHHRIFIDTCLKKKMTYRWDASPCLSVRYSYICHGCQPSMPTTRLRLENLCAAQDRISTVYSVIMCGTCLMHTSGTAHWKTHLWRCALESSPIVCMMQPKTSKTLIEPLCRSTGSVPAIWSMLISACSMTFHLPFLKPRASLEFRATSLFSLGSFQLL